VGAKNVDARRDWLLSCKTRADLTVHTHSEYEADRMAETSGVIGRGTVVKGTLSGSGDVVVQGQIEGTVSLENQLTVEPEGRVFADVESENLSVHGQMSGDIHVNDRVVIASTARVVGDIKAPRVVIEDGARFKGSIEMDVKLPEDI
jgi:cytoskeletal protein CcmA (bactofilin family)